ncbi:MAG: hypothetical protein J6R93_01165 [Tidjanibacter sp.]|nr:hypothetical protein [Tidjanibacter sp.]
MKRIRVAIVILISLICLCGCGAAWPWHYHYSDAFIAVYYCGDLKLNPNNPNFIGFDWFAGDEYAYDSKGENKERYKELCVKHNDTNYDRRAIKPEDAGGIRGDARYRRVFGHDFVEIDVISDRDFDDAHPAGTSLGDVVKYGGKSYWEYVKRGYTGNPVSELDGYINNIPEDGLCLLKYFWLNFPEVSVEASGTHNLQILFVVDDGTELVFNLTMYLEPSN